MVEVRGSRGGWGSRGKGFRGGQGQGVKGF